MYTILLPDEMKVACNCDDVRCAILITELDYQGQAADIFPTEDLRSYSRYTRLQLIKLIENLDDGLGPNLDIKMPYADLLKHVREMVENAPIDKRSLLSLESKAGPKPLPGDIRGIEKEPYYAQLSKPCEGVIARQDKEEGKVEDQPSGNRAPPQKGATKRVWEIADKLFNELEDARNDLKAFRLKVIETCGNEGINPGTAATQYGKWKADKGL